MHHILLRRDIINSNININKPVPLLLLYLYQEVEILLTNHICIVLTAITYRDKYFITIITGLILSPYNNLYTSIISTVGIEITAPIPTSLYSTRSRVITGLSRRIGDPVLFKI